MGMFDTVMVPCPKCGTEDEFQTKSGECLCRTYKLADAPPDVLRDVNRHAPNICPQCGTRFYVKLFARVCKGCGETHRRAEVRAWEEGRVWEEGALAGEEVEEE